MSSYTSDASSPDDSTRSRSALQQLRSAQRERSTGSTYTNTQAPTAAAADEEDYIQRRLIQTSRELLDELHMNKGSWDRSLLEKYVVNPLEKLLDQQQADREQVARWEDGESNDDDDDLDTTYSSMSSSSSDESGSFEDSSGDEREAAERRKDRRAKRHQRRHRKERRQSVERRILLSQSREEKLKQQNMVEQIVKLVNVLAHHKEQTLDVLQAIVRRREALAKLHRLENANLDEAELQTHVLSACYELRNATLRVVESIATWRTGLTLAHPFMFEQKNYLFVIIAEMKQVAELPNISKTVALEFVKFPLFSNMPSLSLFAGDPAKLSGPQSRTKAGHPPPVDNKLVNRLIHAEQYLHDEPERQSNMLKHLMELCARGKFVPTLDISSFYPGLYAKPKANQVIPRKNPGGILANTGGKSGAPTSAANAVRGKLVGIEVHSGADLEKLKTVLMTSLEQLKGAPHM